MALTKTKIETLERVWNPSGWGCARRGISKCPKCNAFEVHCHPERLIDPLMAKHPYRIGVDFMSDLFAPGVSYEWQLRVLEYAALCDDWDYLAHTFVFLTKSPENLPQFNPYWPQHAWVGCTITGGESPERQQEMIEALRSVKAKARWVSWEPMLGPLTVNLEGIDWLVVGAQTGTKPIRPQLEWIVLRQNWQGKIWYKNNLPDSWFVPKRRQELPYEAPKSLQALRDRGNEAQRPQTP